jgi:hypothetical protein
MDVHPKFKMRHRVLGCVTSHPLAVSWVIGAISLNGMLLYLLKTEFGTLSVFFTFPIVLGLLLILATASALGLFAGGFTVGPIIHWLFSTMNGANCKVGDTVVVLSGTYRGRVTRIYGVILGQGGKLFRLDLGEKAKENYDDLFELYSIAPADERLEQTEGGNP